MIHSTYRKLVVFALACLPGLLVSGPAFAQDGDEAAEAQYTDNSRSSVQICAPVVTQYNSIVQGGADAVAGRDAVAEVANEANISNSVVINCIQGDGNDGSDDGSDTDDADNDDTDNGNADNDTDRNVASNESSVIRSTIPNKTLANTGGGTAGLFGAGSASSLLILLGAMLMVAGGILGVRLFGNSAGRG